MRTFAIAVLLTLVIAVPAFSAEPAKKPGKVIGTNAPTAAKSNAPAPKPAKPGDKKFYVSVHGGVFQPNSYSDGLKDFGTGINFGGEFGYRINKYISIEAGVSPYASSLGRTGILNSTDSDNTDVHITPIALTLKGTYNLSPSVVVYADAGVDYCLVKWDYAYTAPSGVKSSTSSRVGSIGIHGGGGAEYEINKSFAIGLDFRILLTTPEVTAGGIKKNVKAGGGTAGLSLKYSFGL